MSNEQLSGRAAANVAEEREKRRWLIPAALGAAVLIVGGLAVQASGSAADSDAERLVERVDEFGSILAGSIMQAAGFLLLAVPIWFLFRSAERRDAPIRPGLRPLVIIGPVLIAISLVLTAFALDSIASDFVADEPTTGDDGEERAEDLLTGSTFYGVSGFMGIAGLLALGFGGLYASLQAMRVGLLTRFWGTLGMAISVLVGLSAIFGSLGLFGLMMFSVVVALQANDRWPGGTPPAWTEGIAIPWPKPGEAPPPRSDEEPANPEDFEGTATEVEPSERPARRDNRRKRKRKAR